MNRITRSQMQFLAKKEVPQIVSKLEFVTSGVALLPPFSCLVLVKRWSIKIYAIGLESSRIDF